MNEEEIGAAVHVARKAAGMSQEGLARAMREVGATHWYQTTVYRVESGLSPLRVSDVITLASVLPGFVIPEITAGSAIDAAYKAGRRVGLNEAISTLEGMRK